MFDNDGPSRRNVLKGTAGLGALSLAGCLGGGGGGSGNEPVDLTVGSSSSGSSTYGNSQAIQRVVSENSDYLNFITQDAGGDPQSIRLYADGEINSYSAGTTS